MIEQSPEAFTLPDAASRRLADQRTSGERTSEILLDLVDNLDAMLAYWDANQRCVFANNAYRDWFGKSRQELLGTTMRELLGPLYAMNLPYIEAALAGDRQVFERTIPLPDGSVRHSLATYTPDIVDGRVRGIFVHVADVTPLKELEAELRAAKVKAEQLATHDFLTGLPNRVLMAERLTHAIALAKRNQQMIALMTVDLDEFKQVNDTHGHSGGDDLLITIASRLTALVRESDDVTRLGGDEFLVVASNVESVEQIESLAARILEHARQPVHYRDVTILPALSVGIAHFPEHGTTVDELMEASDRALYDAKRLGRNRYAFAKPRLLGL